MKSEQFIGEIVSGRQTGEKYVASIHFDGKHIYSYGSHYPLLINTKRKWILNDYGYSSTTSKHISWARSYADYVVGLPNHSDIYHNANRTDINVIKQALKMEISLLEKEISQLSKRAWKQKEIKNNRIEELRKTLLFIS